jgi:hypothetical protein
VQITVFDGTGIENPENPEIEIFPNPSYGKFTIKGENLQSVEIRNITGKVIYSSDDFKSSDEFHFDLKAEAKGIYFVKVVGKDFVEYRKLILI